MVRVPFSRAACYYTGCERRGTCGADGRLTAGRPDNNPTVAPENE